MGGDAEMEQFSFFSSSLQLDFIIKENVCSLFKNLQLEIKRRMHFREGRDTVVMQKRNYLQ